ncbi:DUF1559 family PulG-like putative transporter [Alienimonas californiensis]|uniref:DUF1559 domain-containing protein n=1 Tax=Alienimonas californiensis TaxID=2527989 RepID=A0A517P7P4_9PLAN|nr:DUF1559 domain-containing protein [Alienimonas californiensis]QDT15404.1 hypothetical protein CA12_14890 [Alienimonas californiensis]
MPSFETTPEELAAAPRWGRWLLAAAALGLSISLILPSLEQDRGGHYSVVQNRYKQTGLALINFHTAHDRAFPTPALAAEVAGAGNPVPSWQTVLLPYVDRREEWRAYDLTQPYDHPANAAVVGTEVNEFLNPHEHYESHAAAGGFGLSHLAGNVHVLGEGGAGELRQFRDGTTQTLLVGQVAGFYHPWADPTNLRDSAAGFGFGPRQFGGPQYSTDEGAAAMGGALVVLGDGSVNYLSAEMDPAAFAALGTPDGGERLEEWDLMGLSRVEWERQQERQRRWAEAGSELRSSP